MNKETIDKQVQQAMQMVKISHSRIAKLEHSKFNRIMANPVLHKKKTYDICLPIEAQLYCISQPTCKQS